MQSHGLGSVFQHTQVAGRPTGMLMGWQCTAHPFVEHPSYRAIAELPFDERLARLRDPELRRRILTEEVTYSEPLVAFITSSFHKLFPLGDPPD